MPLKFASEQDLKTDDPSEKHLDHYNNEKALTELIQGFISDYEKKLIKEVESHGHISDGSKALYDNLKNPEGFVYVQKGLHQDKNSTKDQSHPPRNNYLHLTLRIGAQNIYHAWVVNKGTGGYRISEVSTDQHRRY